MGVSDRNLHVCVVWEDYVPPSPMITTPTTKSLLPGENSLLARDELFILVCVVADSVGADTGAVFVTEDVFGAKAAVGVVPGEDFAPGVLDDVGTTTNETVLISVKVAVVVMNTGRVRVRVRVRVRNGRPPD